MFSKVLHTCFIRIQLEQFSFATTERGCLAASMNNLSVAWECSSLTITLAQLSGSLEMATYHTGPMMLAAMAGRA